MHVSYRFPSGGVPYARDVWSGGPKCYLTTVQERYPPSPRTLQPQAKSNTAKHLKGRVIVHDAVIAERDFMNRWVILKPGLLAGVVWTNGILQTS
jgi:hypothetical protein